MHKATASVLVGLWATIFLLSSALAAGPEEYWKAAPGGALADSDAMRSKNGFGALLVVTGDLDWRERLQNASNSIPNFSTVRTIEHGKKIAIFVLAGNPALDTSGRANVRVTFVLTNPKGVKDATAADLECIVGAVERGSEKNIRNCKADLTFSGDDSDPSGLWQVDATVTDANRSTQLFLRAQFQLD